MSAGNEREFIDHLQSKEGKEQAMKCPLRRKAFANTDGGFDNTFLDCIKEECACWDKDDGICSFLSLVFALDDIREQLAFIAKKMPHAGQSTK